MNYDKLSLIYENTLRPNIVREEVLESYLYLVETNKDTEAKYYLENILTSAEIQVLAEQGLLGKIGQGVKKFAKKAAPYAAAGLMVAGGAAKGGEMSMSDRLNDLKSASDRMSQMSRNIGDVMGNNQQTPIQTHTLKYQIESMDAIEKSSRSFLQEAQRTGVQNLTDSQIQNIKNIQDIRQELIGIENFLKNENDLLLAQRKPELKITVNNLNQILNQFNGLRMADDIRVTINKTAQLVQSLKQEVLKIKSQLPQ